MTSSAPWEDDEEDTGYPDDLGPSFQSGCSMVSLAISVSCVHAIPFNSGLSFAVELGRRGFVAHLKILRIPHWSLLSPDKQDKQED